MTTATAPRAKRKLPPATLPPDPTFDYTPCHQPPRPAAPPPRPQPPTPTPAPFQQEQGTFEMWVNADGDRYHITRAEYDTPSWRFAGNHGQNLVVLDDDGWHCSCKGFTTYGMSCNQGRGCKHIRLVVAISTNFTAAAPSAQDIEEEVNF